VGTAHVDKASLDMAISSAWTLYRAAVSVNKINLPNNITSKEIKDLERDLKSAKSMAHELRYLAEMYNDDKY